MTNPSVKLDRRLTLMLPEVLILRDFFDVNNSRRCSGRDVRFIARPPHRTVRAAFPHTAPTSGV